MRGILSAAIAIAAGTALIAVAPEGARATSLLTNGSFENLNNTWVEDGSSGYMSLYANDTTIPGWTVSPTVQNEIVWGKAPDAGYTAATGSYFLELTGIGNDSPNGAVRQTVSLMPGKTYMVSFAWGTGSDAAPGVDVDGTNVTTRLLTVGGDWEILGGSFVAPLDPNPYLEIYNASGGGYALYIDDASLVLTSASTPEPASIALLGVAALGIGLVRRRR
jgi:hypothetical protein